MHHHVFVFGTLKEGFPNFHVNRGLRVPGTFRTTARYPLHLVGERHSPWLIDLPGQGDHVHGQVFKVDPAGLLAMDTLERIAEPDGYRRVQVEVAAVEPTQETRMQAFAYLKQAQHFNPDDARLGPLTEFTLAHAALYRPRHAPTASAIGAHGDDKPLRFS